MRNISALLVIVVFALCISAQKNPSTTDAKRKLLANENKTADDSDREDLDKRSIQTRISGNIHYTNLENTAELKIVEKPPAKYPDQSNGSVCVQGTVRLKVEFLANGEIGRIFPVTRLPYGGTENAIDAVQKIVFVPKMVDGNPITVFASVEYDFRIY